jgi:hypothetical protein
MLWRAKSCSAKDQNIQRWKPLYRWGRMGASFGRSSEGFDNKGISVMKIIIQVMTAFFAVLSTVGLLTVLSAAAAADLPRKEPPPPAPPVGKAPIGKYPVGKYPVGKYPQPVVTKG